MSVVTGVATVDTAKSSRQLVWLNAGLLVLILASSFAATRQLAKLTSFVRRWGAALAG